MTFSDLKDDVLRWMNPIIHPLEWTKDNFAERFCLWFIVFFSAWNGWILFLSMGLSLTSKVFLGISILGALLFVFTLIYYSIVEAQKEKDAAERRKRDAERKHKSL